jgi:hypothetical protein
LVGHTDDWEIDVMSATIRYALILIVLAATALTSVRAAAQTEPLGMYLAKGVNAEGSEYRGLVHIVRHGESFAVSWTALGMSGNTVVLKRVWVGLGILSEGMLAVSYYGPDAAGVVVYRIEENGERLAARWATLGEEGTVHVETLMKIPDTAPSPDAGEPSEEEPAPAAPEAPRSPQRDNRTVAS